MRLHSISIAVAVAMSGCAVFALDVSDKPIADPAAVSALKEAHDMRDTFPTGFPGFSADVAINDNGTEAKGMLTYSVDGKLTVTLNDAAKPQQDWAREQFGSALSHRRQTNFATTEGNLPLTFAENDHSPLGR